VSLFLSEKVRVVRKQKGLTLQELADKTGLSSSLLSQIERGLVDPTVSTFWKICAALNIPFSSFFEGNKETTFVVRKDQRRVVELSNSKVRYHELTPHNHSGNMEFILVEIQPGEITEMELVSHTGEECGFVLQGSLKVCLGDEEIILNEGDSISFQSMVPHRYINPGNEISLSIWAMTPR
jgi:transcriptional regulator with XRE-family HTH domain